MNYWENSMDLTGKNALVFGVANNRSLAWHIAKSLHKKSAQVTLVCQNERLYKKVKKLADSISANLLVCDCDKDDELQKVMRECENIDILVHSIAYAPSHSLEGGLMDVTKQDFLETMNVSVFSLINIIRESKAKMNKGCSIITLSYIGSNRVMKGYNIMGMAKAALESAVKYLSVELGEEGHRINAISAGPVKTLSSSVFPHFNSVLQTVAEKTPLKNNIEGEDVGELASFLASDSSKSITGSIYYVDGGANAIGAI